MIRQVVKALAPGFVIQAYQGISRQLELRKLNPILRELRRRAAKARRMDIQISPQSESARKQVEAAAIKIYGEHYNFYSNALLREIVQGFEKTLDLTSNQQRPIDYLEIGSCRGLSMSLIGTMLAASGRLGSLVSIDPYFESGYVEGQRGPEQADMHVKIDKTTKVQALSLYESLGLKVELIEATSLSGLCQLVGNARKFDLVYIDGSHERMWPIVDFGLSCAVLRPNAVIILDDHLWPDVKALKLMCDKHLERIQETWKTVSYRIQF